MKILHLPADKSLLIPCVVWFYYVLFQYFSKIKQVKYWITLPYVQFHLSLLQAFFFPTGNLQISQEILLKIPHWKNISFLFYCNINTKIPKIPIYDLNKVEIRKQTELSRATPESKQYDGSQKHLSLKNFRSQ